ncbi:unnamed protein product [Miscanthus lutarioriparius]|uniref:F-box/LRR-repeat protein 15/At3g58940/PEG3-like LRR domain-containing protein n=1 Tax=Miscanthus lutarioriparius TaxID=422564 RepID=A0A811N581_9POAL|nr:unnamed protein product [Miscanthus lutarioriparius]
MAPLSPAAPSPSSAAPRVCWPRPRNSAVFAAWIRARAAPSLRSGPTQLAADAVSGAAARAATPTGRTASAASPTTRSSRSLLAPAAPAPPPTPAVSPAVVAALAQVALPELSILDINVTKRFKFSAAGVASLLRTAARLALVELTIIVWGDRKDIDIAVELPCFDRATTIRLELGDVKLAPAVAGGEFPLLERLSVAGCRLATASASLISQCPHLRALELRRSEHPDVLRVHSTKIEKLVIDCDTSSWLGAVDIDAPVLKKFTMNTIIDRDFSMSFSAPMVEILS